MGYCGREECIAIAVAGGNDRALSWLSWWAFFVLGGVDGAQAGAGRGNGGLFEIRRNEANFGWKCLRRRGLRNEFGVRGGSGSVTTECGGSILRKFAGGLKPGQSFQV